MLWTPTQKNEGLNHTKAPSSVSQSFEIQRLQEMRRNSPFLFNKKKKKKMLITLETKYNFSLILLSLFLCRLYTCMVEVGSEIL